MKYVHTRLVSPRLIPAALLLAAAPAFAVQFPTIDPNYSQSIYTAPLQTSSPPNEGGFAWTTAGNLLTRTGSVVNEYSLTQNITINSTFVRSTIANVAVPGLSSSGVGMTNGLDGYVYTVTAGGLQRFDPNNLLAPAQNLTGTVGGNGWGITTMPNGNIAYSDGSAGNVYVYTPNANPTLGTNVHIYSGGSLIDGMVAGPGGQIAVANQSAPSITIMTSTGTPILTIPTTHYPDGLAFASITSSTSTIYSNNNDGTVTKYVLTPGYTALISATDIAGVSGAYGDLAAVGPDSPSTSPSTKTAANTAPSPASAPTGITTPPPPTPPTPALP